jgi:hypothetical protein
MRLVAEQYFSTGDLLVRLEGVSIQRVCLCSLFDELMLSPQCLVMVVSSSMTILHQYEVLRR